VDGPPASPIVSALLHRVGGPPHLHAPSAERDIFFFEIRALPQCAAADCSLLCIASHHVALVVACSVVNRPVRPTSPRIRTGRQLSVRPLANIWIMDGDGQQRQPGTDQFRPGQSPAVIYRPPWTLFNVYHKNNMNLVYT